MGSAECRCLLDADWCLRSDVMAHSRCQAGDDHFSEESMLAKRLAVDLSLVPSGEARFSLDRVRRHSQHGSPSIDMSPQPRRKIIKSKRILGLGLI